MAGYKPLSQSASKPNYTVPGVNAPVDTSGSANDVSSANAAESAGSVSDLSLMTEGTGQELISALRRVETVLQMILEEISQ